LLSALGGFAISRGQCFVPRSNFIPTHELINQVFPIAAIAIEIEQSKEAPGISHEISGAQFLKLLEFLAIVFLQDAAILYNHPD
jgi:hypothetical protein